MQFNFLSNFYYIVHDKCEENSSLFSVISAQHGSAEECVKSKQVKLEDPEGYLSVKLGHKAHVPMGTEDCPLQVRLGQELRIKVNMLLCKYCQNIKSLGNNTF